MDYAETIRFLYGLEHGTVKLGLERIAAAVAAAGHPERRYATVHVAGTNGKGSTCALLAAILEAAGWRTGLLTSPHLLEFTERIRIAGRLLPQRAVVRLTREARPLIQAHQLSFFEATTLLAFQAFAQAEVDVAIVEVGMGGRLDATNVVAPQLTVVTGIDLDHTQSLGRTRPRIAREKAGIMKPGVPLLLGPCRADVEAVFAARARALDAPLERRTQRVVAERVTPLRTGTRYVWRRPERGETGTQRILLRGEHQVANALLADEAARLLDGVLGPVPEAARRTGLAVGRWPGRFDLLRGRAGEPDVVLDVAHNVQGAAALRAAWAGWVPEARRPGLIVGMLGDKNQAAFLRALRPLSERLCLIPLDSPRAGPLARLAKAARRAGFQPRGCAGIAEAWAHLRTACDTVLITGSFLTVEAGLRLLGRRPPRTLFPSGARGAHRRQRPAAMTRGGGR